MANTIRFQLRGDTAANWESKNPVLLRNEPGYDITNKRLKLGDGVSQWTSLEYVQPDVINDLVSNSTTDALSAEQGRILKELVDGKSDVSVEIINNLTSTRSDAALSAAQGKELKSLIDKNKVNVINNLTSTSTTDALSAKQGKELKALIDKKQDTSSLKNESWTFTLSTGSTVTKSVVLK